MNAKFFNAILGLFLIVAVTSATAEPVRRQRIPCGDAAPGAVCPSGTVCCDAPTFFNDGHCIPEGDVCPQ
ncbi:hypothetical protein D9758_013056 [Tetrapyrgos nigripes]|uniref:Uncharacterized protein n=1 Tax=Tetrapyrgos nigripes TaxID=182062 RepID=A0A8H5CRD3_9AGAR|nr:hypothetical protein D9758_013056 [Tetrapyrgos nigripes]